LWYNRGFSPYQGFTVNKALENCGTVAGISGSASLALIGAMPALVLFSLSSTFLLVAAVRQHQKNFVCLQLGFMVCNIMGLAKIFFL